MRSLRLAVLTAAVVGVSVSALAGRGMPPGSFAHTFRAPGDSVLIRFGDMSQWIHLAGVPSPDTTWLDPDHDLFLVSASDSCFVPRSVGSAVVHFVRTADTLTEVFHFQSRSARDLAAYRALLRRYARFDSQPMRLPMPLAAGATPAEVAELRRLFPLDSIAGGGGDLARMRRLLHWVHTSIRWDGSQENPSAATVGQSMTVCIEQGRTMNCGGLAASYAAVCQAAGLPARQIVCLPFDRADPDCHSVTIVYSRSLGHWVYMDPTFEAWWTDAQGQVLGLQAARELLAAEDTVMLNREANTNGQRREAPDHLAYMSKNVFRFRTWLADGAALELVPCDYDTSDAGAVHAGGTRRNITRNPAVFWAAPPRR